MRKALVPLDKEALRGWGEYFAISIPATIMICSEWWAFEVIMVIAGLIGVVEMATITIVFSYTPLLFMFMLGIQEGTCTLIGNSIGANNIALGKRFYYLIAKIALVTMFTLSLITLFCRRQLVAAFTNQVDVKEMATAIFLLIAVMSFFDGGQCFLQGPIRAMGL